METLEFSHCQLIPSHIHESDQFRFYYDNTTKCDKYPLSYLMKNGDNLSLNKASVAPRSSSLFLSCSVSALAPFPSVLSQVVFSY